MNSLFLTIENLNSLGVIAQIYQSVLTNQIVRSGKLFLAENTSTEKPKLGRMISSIRLKASVNPLILGILAETEDLTGVVGVRIRSEQMDVDLRLTQRQIERNLKGQVNPLKRKSVTKWNLEESEVDFVKVEMRSFSCGFDSGTDGSSFKSTQNGSEEGASEMDWILDEDFNYLTDISSARLYSFITSPKLSYYLRNENNEKAEEQEHQKNLGIV